MEKIILTFGLILVSIGVVFSSHFIFRTPDTLKADTVVNENKKKTSNKDESDEGKDLIEEIEADYFHEIEEDDEEPLENIIPTVTNPNNIAVLVNRKHLLPENYEPKDLRVPDVKFSFYGTYERSYMRAIAAFYLEKMFKEAEKKDVILKGVSGYRSYKRQKAIYDNNVRNRGKEKTDAVSAKPASSEHQTGLTIDVSADSAGDKLGESFGNTTEGIWLAKNAHRYGFIIRYPKGKEKITGYNYEPWHIRYVGRSLATYLYKNEMTLEEYYKYTTVDNKINTKADVIRYKKEKAKKEKLEAEKSPSPSPASYKKDKNNTKKEVSEALPTKTPTPKATKKNSVKATVKPNVKPTNTAKAVKTPSPTSGNKVKQSAQPKDNKTNTTDTTETTDETA